MQTIFVVDDEKVIADTLAAILRGSGYDAIAFYDAETALASCEHHPPDFVITDVSMPGMNGIEMGAEIRNRLPGCGILLFSGQAGTSDLLETAYRKGYVFELITNQSIRKTCWPNLRPQFVGQLSFKANRTIQTPWQSESILEFDGGLHWQAVTSFNSRHTQ